MYYVLEDIKVLGTTVAKKGDLVGDNAKELPDVKLVKIKKVELKRGELYVMIKNFALYNSGDIFAAYSNRALKKELDSYSNVNLIGAIDLSYHFVSVKDTDTLLALGYTEIADKYKEAKCVTGNGGSYEFDCLSNKGNTIRDFLLVQNGDGFSCFRTVLPGGIMNCAMDNIILSKDSCRALVDVLKSYHNF